MILLSHFSSFIEIIAAVYISMCIDDVLKGFWTTKYYKDLEDVLKKYYLENHDNFINRIVESNKKKAESIAMYMKNRAIFFFILCMIILYLSGFEESKIQDVLPLVQETMLITVVFSFILMFFNRFFFASKARTAVGIILVVLLSTLTSLANYYWFGIYIPSAYVVHVVLLFLISPVLWQAFVCWTYSGPYRDYITYKLAKGKINYEQTEKGITEHNPKLLPKRFRELYLNKSIESSNAEEAKRACLDDYLEQMEEAISKASDSRYAFKIFTLWVYYCLRGFVGRFAIQFGLKKVNIISQQQEPVI